MNLDMCGDVFVDGVNASVKALDVALRRLAQSNVPVLLLGEHGTGKKAIARRIHELSSGSGGEFHALDCTTSSDRMFIGEERDVLSRGGTIFLREFASLCHQHQVDLVRMLPATDECCPSQTNVRMICSSTKDLEVEVNSGRLREDLYYRVSAVCLRLPPLRQRKEDIPHFMNFFMAKHARELGLPTPALAPESQHLFEEYSWPGNVRELENTAKAIVALGGEALVLAGLRALLTKPAHAPSCEQSSLKQVARAASRAAERELILKVLTRTRWNRRRAAQELQISYKALLYKLKQIGYDEYGAS